MNNECSNVYIRLFIRGFLTQAGTGLNPWLLKIYTSPFNIRNSQQLKEREREPLTTSLLHSYMEGSYPEYSDHWYFYL